MPIRFKTGGGGAGDPYGGSWVGPISDGNMRVKWGGSSWSAPGYCRIKSGPVGSGSWVDSSYRGYPNPPSAPWVNAWDYSQVQAAWSYASGGPAIAYYEVQLLYPDGNLWAVENSTDNVSPNWGIGQDARARIRVRSVGANGLTSAWSSELRVGTGHPETYNYGWVQRTRYWATGGSIGHEGRRDNLAGWAVPSNVVCSSIHWQLWTSDGDSPLAVYPAAFVQGGNRQIQIILNESYVWYEGVNWPNPLDGWDYPVFWGNGGRTGFICRNNGWDGRECHGNVWLDGTEYYNNWEIVSTNPAQGNYYW